MDRRKFYDDQLVADVDLNAEVTNTYNAIGNMMSDIGIFGIISGGDITEQAAPSMSVDMSTPFIGYDQDGERIYKATGDVIDCSVDYLGNPTVPTTPGEKVWLSIHGRFTYTEEDPKVIEGDTKYLTWAESYEWRVVAGTPAGGGGHVKPAKPSDAILIADIELDYGHTTILTADIDESRKDTFVFAAAAAISVVGAGFTKLSTAIDDVQEALDAIDAMIISRNGFGEIDQVLLAEDQTQHIGSASKPFGDVYARSLLNAALGTETVGAAAEPYAEGHFEVLYAQSSIKAHTDALAIGEPTKRFDAHFLTSTIYTRLAAAVGGEFIGDASEQFAAHLSAVTLYGNLADRLKFSAAKSVKVMIPITEFLNLAGTDWGWNSTRIYITCTVSGRSALIYFKLSHGVTLQSMRVRWAQASGTGMTSRIYSLDEDNGETPVGAAKTISVIDGTMNWDIIASSLGHAVNRETHYHRVKVTTTQNAVSHQVAMLEATFDVVDILKSALYNCS